MVRNVPPPPPPSIRISRFAASFSKTQEPDWRVIGDPALGPGTYKVERAEPFTLPSPSGGAGDADTERPSPSFRTRRTPFDLRRLADGYKTLKPRFSTPRSVLHTSDLSDNHASSAVVATSSVCGALGMEKTSR